MRRNGDWNINRAGGECVPLETRLRAGLRIIPETGCWEWQRSRSHKGYGQIGIRSGVMKPTHRIAWTLFRGEIPKGMFVCHHCDNPPCCNPNHLFLGTNRDNIIDAVRKGRVIPPNGHRWLRGQQWCRAKLTDAEVRDIRERWQMGERNQRTMAREFGVSFSSIHLIVHGKTWKHVTLEAA